MRNLFLFLKKYYFVLLFLFIESLSLYLYFSNHRYQKSKILSFTQEYTGAIYNYYSNISEYLNLKKENKFLKKENAKLYSMISYEKENNNTNHLYNYIPARIINNSVYKKDNFIVINRGRIDGVKEGMGIMTDNGIIGIISSISNNYSKAISILNSKSSVSIKHVKSNQNGSLKWTNHNYMEAEINDIPNHANISLGDTIQSNGFSSIFPENINIGTIISYNKGNENGLYNIKVKFLCDMNNITNVYIINSLHKKELEEL